MDNGKDILIGAAIGSLLGSLALALYPRRREILKRLQEQSDYLSDRAYDTSEYLLEEAKARFPLQFKQKSGNQFLAGSIVGAIAGAGLAFLLAPKTGRQLRNQLARAYSDVSERTQDLMDRFEIQNGTLQRRVKHPVRQAKKKKRTTNVHR